MATYTKFEGLPVRQEARRSYKEISAITPPRASSRKYRFCRPIKAAAGSITDNVAEGFERTGGPAFVNHLRHAKDSVGEVRSQSYGALNASFVNEKERLAFTNGRAVPAAGIASLIRYFNRCKVRGLPVAGRNENAAAASFKFTKASRASLHNRK